MKRALILGALALAAAAPRPLAGQGTPFVPCGAESVVRAGTFVPALLITAVNSDIPGDIIAQVSRDVFDYQMRCLMIPRGSRLIGRYDSQIAVGQNRLVVAWTLLQFPDGTAVELPGLAGVDERGQTGVRDKVNNHYRQVFGSAALLSLIGAGFGAAQPQAQVYGSAQQSASQAAAAQMQQVASGYLERNLDIKPTIEIRAASRFQVMINRDMILPVRELVRASRD